MKIEDIFRKEAIISKHKAFGETVSFNNESEKVQLFFICFFSLVIVFLLLKNVETEKYIPINKIEKIEGGQLVIYSDFEQYNFDLSTIVSAWIVSPNITEGNKIKITNLLVSSDRKSIKFFSDANISCLQKCYLVIDYDKRITLVNSII